MGSFQLPSRKPVLDDVATVVARAATSGEPIFAGSKAQRIAIENLDSGMTERDISEHIVRLAVEKGIAVDTTR